MPGPVPNARARDIEESVTLAIASRAMQLKATGADVVSLGAGEPDFPTPEPIAKAGIDAIKQGRYRYTATSGTPQLRAAGAAWFQDAFGLSYETSEVMATAGAKPALHMALDTIVEKNDRVLILAPYWVSYPALVSMADGQAVIVPAVPERGFLHSAESIAAAAAEHQAKGIILNYPNNPSGAVPGRDHIEALVRVACDHDMWILSDEIYAMLCYDNNQHVSPAAVPGGKERSIVVTGFTKSHTLTGWRIGFMAGPKEVIAAAGRIQSQVLGNPSTISQEAALAACAEPTFDEARRRVASFDERRQFLVREINAIPDLSLTAPQGAFYALVDARPLCERLGLSDIELCGRLLEERLLSTIPGSAFGSPGFIRLSYAASLQTLQQATQRLRKFVEEAR